MRISVRSDLLLNVIIPVLCGISIYQFPGIFGHSGFTRNHLPDGLWAYALSSTLLITWNRKVHTGWFAVAGMLFIFYELMQYFNLLDGTGDVADILIYLTFTALAILLNLYFKPNTIQHDPN